MTNYILVWPERPVEKHGGMYPHVIAYDNPWNEPGTALTNYLYTVCMPGYISWPAIRNLKSSDSYEKLRAYISSESLDPLVRFMFSKTLEITVEPKEGIPAWQCLRVAYHTCPIRLSEDKPRMVCSFPYFVKKYYKVEVTDDLLREVYAQITGDLSLKFKEFSLHLKNGSDEDAPEVFTHVYTNVANGYSGINPSVNGSCMRRKEWSTQWGTIGISGDLPHPVTAYCVEPLALAWLENSEGETVARTLVNTDDKQFHRVYRWASHDCEQPSKYACELEDHLVNQLTALGYTRGSEVLEGVALRLNKIPGTDLCVAPYLDGDYSYINPRTMTVDDTGYSWRHHNPPVQQCSGDIFECCDCGEQIFPGDEHEVGGDIFCSEHVPDERECCCHCGEPIDSGEGYTCDDGRLCESCFNDHYFCCVACGEVHPLDDERIAEDDSYCPDCFDRRFVTCFHCGIAVRIGEHDLTPAGFPCCSDCFDGRYAACEDCGETFEHDDLTNGRCSSCVPTELEATNESQ
jgi:hypothetical protein